MPKRVVDGEGLWGSDKLARVEPKWMRSEYANLLPLALANGVFEANAARIWSRVYSFNRPEISVADVEKIFAELQRAGLLFRWVDGEGKPWGFWVGIDRPGRLPGPSRRGRNESVGPKPPAKELRKFLESNGIHKLPGSGSGSGLGTGLGDGNGWGGEAAPSAQPAPEQPLAYSGKYLRITDEEHTELVGKFCPLLTVEEMLAEYDAADAWMGKTGKRWKDNEAGMRKWFRNELKDRKAKAQGGKYVSRAEQRTRRNLEVLGLLPAGETAHS